MNEQPINEVKQEEKPKMKTLANCSPRDFLVQTNKIRKKAADWIELTKIAEIRKRAPVFTDDMDDEAKAAAAAAQARANIYAMMDSAMEDHPDETAELLGMLCFIDPEDLNSHSALDFLAPATELINNPQVIDFFTSLVRLGLTDTSTLAKA